jgi:hypothetical protein
MKKSQMNTCSSDASDVAHHLAQNEVSLIGSRANALKHGLSATTLVPEILRPGRVEALYQQLCQEFCPESLSDELLIREIARHAARLELTEQAEGATILQGANVLSLLLNPGQPDPDEMLVAATTSDALERVARYRRSHEKAFHQAMNALRERLRERGRQSQNCRSADLFATEAACRDHLRAPFRDAAWRCPKCGAANGHWLESRACWECGACGGQVSLRHGTIFEKSPLSLATWFAAIRYVVADSALNAVKLAKLVSISRPATAQAMLRRIKQALAEEDASTKLAGLAAYPLWPR